MYSAQTFFCEMCHDTVAFIHVSCEAVTNMYILLAARENNYHNLISVQLQAIDCVHANV